MSELKDNVVSLETAKTLVDAGIVVESYFCFRKWKNSESWYLRETLIIEFYEKQIPAPTFSELWQQIPTQRNFILDIDEVDGQMVVTILDRLGNELFQRSNKLPQEALAEILIQLKKEGLI